MISLALGIDIGGTNTKFGAVDREGQLHAQGSLRTADHETLEGFVLALAEGCRACLKDLDSSLLELAPSRWLSLILILAPPRLLFQPLESRRVPFRPIWII